MNRFFAVFILFSLTTLKAFAGDGFFIHPYLGMGVTDVTGVSNFKQRNMFRPMPATAAGISIGRHFGNFRIDVGGGFLTTGYKHKQLSVSGLTGLFVDTVDITVRHTHILLPVMAGYTFLNGGSVTITPAIGMAPCYNAQSQSTWKYYSTGEETKTVLSNQPGNPFAEFSLIGIVSATVAYHLNEHLEITFTPTGYFTVTPMMQNSVSNQHNYAIMGNLGLLISL